MGLETQATGNSTSLFLKKCVYTHTNSDIYEHRLWLLLLLQTEIQFGSGIGPNGRFEEIRVLVQD